MCSRVYFLKLKVLSSFYFFKKKVRQRNLCTNILRSIKVQDLPSLGQYPKSHQVTFLYYHGRLLFLEAAYQQVMFIFILKLLITTRIFSDEIIFFLLILGRRKVC